ncbi:hypothetical protein [Chelatococcus asaccharovorans]|uniref:hypothetical protein n=1 Tax=Chelatococcus asaccharovorans TaxID=28210 RepID=UPI00224C6CFD|nr:hypothetical protein [Chelatococcus asaccharovorans]CAH1664786.1 conserved membrane hypothetical protein [Chelatococcus asaccharovorans]CAH1682242.1 conserved membrane hypothetical protein [Chelatococcus asaccharovorans]
MPKFTAASDGASHAAPPLWLPATTFALLFIVGLFFVTAFNGLPYYPGPWEEPETIAHFFALRGDAAATCAAFQFGSAVPLGIYAATAYSRFGFHDVRAAGPAIALFGGITTALTLIMSSAIGWGITFPGIAQDVSATHALYRVAFALGGPGFSVPFGLLILGIAIPGGLTGLLPRWLFWSGVVIGVIGELSWLDLFWPKALPLVPLTRFPGFVWLILAGVWLPARRVEKGAASA